MGRPTCPIYRRILQPSHHSLESPAATTIQQERHHQNQQDEPDRTNAPAGAHAPVQTAATSEQEK